MEPLYAWHQLAADIALSYQLTEDRELVMATELSLAIQTGKVQCWNANGDPIRGAVSLENFRNPLPHLTVTEGNAWLKSKGYLQEWTPSVKKSHRNGTDKRWNEKAVKLLQEYRQTHTESETAEHFGISGSRVRQILTKSKKTKSFAQKNTFFSGLGKK